MAKKNESRGDFMERITEELDKAKKALDEADYQVLLEDVESLASDKIDALDDDSADDEDPDEDEEDEDEEF